MDMAVVRDARERRGAWLEVDQDWEECNETHSGLCCLLY